MEISEDDDDAATTATKMRCVHARRPYTGFRHVTGVLQWPALEKANFIAQLVQRNGWDYVKIAERLGSYPKHIERHYVAHQLVEQAREEEVDTTNIEDRAFGVLLRALQAKGVAEFLGTKFPGDPRKSKKPVPQNRLDNLKYFIEWAFGTKNRAKVLQDSRQLTQLGRKVAITCTLNGIFDG